MILLFFVPIINYLFKTFTKSILKSGFDIGSSVIVWIISKVIGFTINRELVYFDTKSNLVGLKSNS
jgi:hypothetical protein